MKEEKIKKPKPNTKDTATSCEFVLSKKQQNKLQDKLTNIYNTIVKEPNPKIDEKTQEDIRLAANCGVKELFDIACLVAMAVIKPNCLKIANKYQEPPYVLVEDLLNAPLYEVIRDNIKNYNAKFALFTYFNSYVKHAFMIAREEGRGSGKTKYHMDTLVIINRAKNELKAEGFDNVSAPDLSKWIELHYGKDISPTTITKLCETNVKILSIEGMEKKQIENLRSPDPAKVFEEKARKETFRKSIRELDRRHALFLEAALEFIEETGEIPKTQSHAIEICEKFMGKKIPRIQAERIMRGAFKQYVRRYKLNKGKSCGICMFDDIQIMENNESYVRNIFDASNYSKENNMIEDEIVIDELD